MLISLLAVLATLAVPPTRLALHRHSSVLVSAGPSDARIFGTLSILDAAMIEAATLASSRASSQEVRDYADTLLRDHRRSQLEGDSLAKRLGFTAALPHDERMAHDHIRTMTRLRHLSGAAFDQVFMEGMVEDHGKAIAILNNDLFPKASSAELKALIRRLVPALTKHELRGREWLKSHDD